MSEILREIVTGLKKPRTGWINRDIPEEIAETVFLHIKKVVRAAKIFGKNIPELNYDRFCRMGVYHDLAEYSEEDYTPGQIPLMEKHQRERAVIELLRDKLGRGQEIYDIWMEFEEGQTLEAVLMVQLDKLDAAIQALEYEKQGFEKVVDFYPYVQARLTHPVLKNTFEILLRKDFLEVDFYEQYFLLLELEGDEERFYHIMNLRQENRAQ